MIVSGSEDKTAAYDQKYHAPCSTTETADWHDTVHSFLLHVIVPIKLSGVSFVVVRQRTSPIRRQSVMMVL